MGIKQSFVWLEEGRELTSITYKLLCTLVEQFFYKNNRVCSPRILVFVLPSIRDGSCSVSFRSSCLVSFLLLY